jgi:hypothetical protein
MSLALRHPEITRRMRSYIRAETKTDKVTLEGRRDRLQARIAQLWRMFEMLQDPKTEDAEKQKILNLCGVYGMLGLLEGLTFIADSVTTRVVVKSKDPEGRKVRTPVRYSIAMTAEDIAGAAIDTATLSDASAKIARDGVLMLLDPERKREWYDENGVLRCPHYREDAEGDESLTKEEEEALEKAGEERKRPIADAERDLVDRVVQQYVKGGPPA